MDDRTRALVRHRRQLVALEPAARIDAILASPRPAELVRALPAQEFFLTLVEGGLDRALPLLPHASTHQVEFLFDIDAWNRDVFDPVRAGEWLGTLHEADPALVLRWLREADEQLVVLTLARLLHVYKSDESTDQSFWPPDRPVPTLDGTYYVEQRDDAPEAALPALWEGLTRLREQNRPAYEALLEEVLWAIPPELEEENYERRASRLAEKGFPGLEEALGVWSAPTRAVDELRARVEAELPPGGAVPTTAVQAAAPLPPVLAAHGVLAPAAARLSEDDRERLQLDLVRLGNRFAVASGEPLGDPETHRTGLRTALSAVGLGLELLVGDDDAPRAADALRRLSVFDLNMAGVGAVMTRANRARRLDAGWLRRVRYAKERLSGALLDALEGLLRHRPVLVLAGEARPFRDPDDLKLADGILDVVEALGAWLEERLGAGADDLPELDPLPLFRESPADIDWAAVALTTLARAALGDPPRPVPLSREEARRALAELRTRFDDLAADLGVGAAAGFVAAHLEQDAGALDASEEPDPRLVTALLFR